MITSATTPGGEENKYTTAANDNTDLSHLEEFSKLGIKLSYVLNEFVNECGGRAKLEGLTTTDVCETFVKTATNKCRTSYCDKLLEEGKQSVDWFDDDSVAVDRATVFISHAWKYEFLHVLSALEDHFKDEPDTIIWFDLFSNNQHKASELPYEWWQNVFKSAIADFDHTVMVMSPWNNPIPYTRAWCIFEAYCNIKTESKFEIAMSAHDRKQFIKDTIKNPEGTINKMLGVINAENSTASNPADLERIFEVIRNEVGFSNINTLVFEQLRAWVIDVAKKELEMNTDEKMRPKLMRMLGTLYFGQGKYEASQPLLEESMEKFRATLGPDHPDTLVSINDISVLFYMQGKYAAAEPLYVECLEKRRGTLGSNHPDTLSSINNLALLYSKLGKYEAAEDLFLECLEKSKYTRGRDHPDTLTSLNNLAGLYKEQGKYEAAEPLFLECLEKRKASPTLGTDHPDTLASINNLALLYKNQGKYNASEPLYEECLEKLKAILGPDHPHTLASISNLAGLYKEQGAYDSAEALHMECLEKRKSILGLDHPDTVDSINGLAVVYKKQGKYEAAEALFVECLEKRKATVGPSHLDTLISINNLAVLYRKQGKYGAAEPLYVECLEKLKTTLGPDHPETLTSANNLALLYKKQRKYEAAEALFEECLEKRRTSLGKYHEKTRTS